MKKLNIIEIGRILTKEELKKIHGGDSCSSLYEGCNKHSDCLSGHMYLTCSVPTSSYGYETDGTTTTCNSGYTYGSCTSTNNYTTCSVDSSYNSTT